MTSHDKSRKQATVLIVDDDAVVTRSLNAFLSLETEYRIIESQAPRDALEFLNSTPVDLVITDFLMPEMNGLQFLQEVKKLCPEVPRIMLTGYADKENAIRAINEVGLFQYIEKPWDNDQILLAIHNAIRAKTLEETLAERIHELDEVLLDRARLETREGILNEELRQARLLQHSMLPETLPNINGISMAARYIPALEIGGDFYDVIPLAGDRLGVLVADATGHGIQAALSTAIVKFAFSSFAHGEAEPVEIVRGMNRILFEGLPRDTFAAALVAVIDPSSSECRLVNAGNPHPYRLRGAGREGEHILTSGFILGIVDNSLYPVAEEMTIKLDTHDTLLLYTDGLSEVENESGEQFDASELEKTLTKHKDSKGDELFVALLDSSRAFAKKDHKWDDITIVGIDMA